MIALLAVLACLECNNGVTGPPLVPGDSSTVRDTVMMPDSTPPPPPPPAPVNLRLAPVATGLVNPTYLASPPGDQRIFVVEQAGRIRVIQGGQVATTPWLDISSGVGSGGERGLLSVAF